MSQTCPLPGFSGSTIVLPPIKTGFWLGVPSVVSGSSCSDPSGDKTKPAVPWRVDESSTRGKRENEDQPLRGLGASVVLLVFSETFTSTVCCRSGCAAVWLEKYIGSIELFLLQRLAIISVVNSWKMSGMQWTSLLSSLGYMYVLARNTHKPLGFGSESEHQIAMPDFITGPYIKQHLIQWAGRTLLCVSAIPALVNVQSTAHSMLSGPSEYCINNP